MADSIGNGATRASSGDALAAAFRRSASDWTHVLGLPLAALALFAFVTALAGIPISPVVAPLVHAYRAVTSVFDLLERLLRIGVPDLIRDGVVFWTVLGLVGGRTILWFSRCMFEIADEAAKKANVEPDARRRLEARRDFHQSTLDNRMSLYLGCAVTGPLFFLHILRVNPRMPAFTPVTGRHMVLVEAVLLLAAFGGLIVLNALTA